MRAVSIYVHYICTNTEHGRKSKKRKNFPVDIFDAPRRVPITDITHAKKRRRKRHLWHYYKTDGPRIRRLRKTNNSTAAADPETATDPAELPNPSANISSAPTTTEAALPPFTAASPSKDAAKGPISIATAKTAADNAEISDPEQPQATTGATAAAVTRTTVGTENVLSKATPAPSTTSGPSDDYNDIFYEDYIDFYEEGGERGDESSDMGETDKGGRSLTRISRTGCGACSLLGILARWSVLSLARYPGDLWASLGFGNPQYPNEEDRGDASCIKDVCRGRAQNVVFITSHKKLISPSLLF